MALNSGSYFLHLLNAGVAVMHHHTWINALLLLLRCVLVCACAGLLLGDGSSFYHRFWGSNSGNQVCTARALNTWAISTTLILYFDWQIYVNIFMMVTILLKSEHISCIDQTKAIRMPVTLNRYHSFVVSSLNGSTSWNLKSFIDWL